MKDGAGLREPREIAERALAVALVVQRSWAEGWLREDPKVGRSEYRGVTEWADKAGLRAFLEPPERDLFERPLGGWSQDEIRGHLSQDGLATLLWSLGLLERLPDFGESFEQEDLSEVMEKSDFVEDLLRNAKPRSREEIQHALSQLGSWHFRATTQMSIDHGMPAPPEGWEAFLRSLAETAHNAGHASLVDGDFSVAGRPFRDLSKKELLVGIEMLELRLIAGLWLIGGARDWASAAATVRGEDLPPADAPSAEQAAWRALCLACLLSRARFEQMHAVEQEVGDGKRTQSAHERALRILKESGIAASLSPKERELIFRDPGRWTLQEMRDAGWRSEALGVLLWALSLLDELPPYDVSFDDERLFDLVFGKSGPEEFVARARLRVLAALNKGEGAARLWVFRAQSEYLARINPDHDQLGAASSRLAAMLESAARDRAVPPLIDGDLPAYGKPVKGLGERELNELRSRALERHLAHAWLCGMVPEWDAGMREP